MKSDKIYKTSEKYYLIALKLQPNNPLFMANIIDLYAKTKQKLKQEQYKKKAMILMRSDEIKKKFRMSPQNRKFID